jgi:hypothetical protein
MKNFNVLKLALTLAITAQSSAVFAMGPDNKSLATEAETKSASFAANHKTAIQRIVIGGLSVGAAAGLGWLGYDFYNSYAAKKTKKAAESIFSVKNGLYAGAATLTLAGLVIYLWKNSGLAKGMFSGRKKWESFTELAVFKPCRFVKNIASKFVPAFVTNLWTEPKTALENKIEKTTKEIAELEKTLVTAEAGAEETKIMNKITELKKVLANTEKELETIKLEEEKAKKDAEKKLEENNKKKLEEDNNKKKLEMEDRELEEVVNKIDNIERSLNTSINDANIAENAKKLMQHKLNLMNKFNKEAKKMAPGFIGLSHEEVLKLIKKLDMLGKMQKAVNILESMEKMPEDEQMKITNLGL